MSKTWMLVRLKARIFRQVLRSARREPRLKKIVVGGFVAMWIAGGFILMYEGIVFIAGFPGIGEYLTRRLFYLFAFGMFLMLLFSSAVIAYPVLFGRRENDLLFSLPIPRSAIVACKIAETVFLSSWAFALMAFPLTLAYFLGSGLGIAPFFLSWLYFIPLAALCGGGGLLMALVAGRFVPRWGGLKGRLLVAILCAACALAIWKYGGARTGGGDERLRFVNGIVGRSRFASFYLLPSSWAADGIAAVGSGRFGDAAFLWALLVSNAFFAYALCAQAGEAFLASGADSRGSSARPPARAGSFLSLRGRRSAVSGLAVKDILTFCRDPGQWGQFAMFFGLLGLYIANLRNLPYDLGSLFWRYLLFILNLSAMGFTLAGLSSRFFFPLVSMELRMFWFLLPSPLPGARRIIREKYLLCVVFTIGVTALLALLSGIMLRVSSLLLASSLCCVACMGVAISGLSVGLGALYPNPRASSSAEVVSGLGGTVVLVLTTLYICAALCIQGLPLYLHVKGVIPDSLFPLCLFAGMGSLAAASAAVAAVALRAGRMKLESMDF